MKAFACAAMALALAGCAPGDGMDWGEYLNTAVGPPAEVKIASDSYCSTVRKLTWSKHDTPETIDRVTKHNARVDAVCAKGKAKSPAPELKTS